MEGFSHPPVGTSPGTLESPDILRPQVRSLGTSHPFVSSFLLTRGGCTVIGKVILC